MGTYSKLFTTLLSRKACWANSAAFMQRAIIKVPLALLCVLAGGALLYYDATSIMLSLTAKSGLHLPQLIGLAVGVALCGAAADFMFGKRADAEPSASSIAKSEWATRRDLVKAGIAEDAPQANGKEGIYLGQFEDGTGQPVRLRYRRGKHVLVIGVPESNKSVGLAIPNIANLRRSMIIVDIKGELAAVTARARQKLGKVIVVNPFDELLEGRPWLESHGINFFLYLDPASPDFAATARTIADCIVTKSTGGSSEFFNASAVNLLTLFIMWVVYSNKGGKPELWQVRVLLTQPTLYDKKTKQPVSGLLHTLALMSQCPLAPIRDGASRMLSRMTNSNAQSTSSEDVIDTLLKDLAALLDDPRMCRDMSDGYIDFAAMHREITTVYLIAPLRELANQAKWLRIFISIALRSLYANPPTDGVKLPPILFLLDEMGQLGAVNEISKALTAARGYSIQLLMVLQSLSQIKAHYPQEYPQFFTGSGAIVSFAPKDNETADYLSKMYGNKEEKVMTVNASGESLTPTATPICRPEDVMRLGQSEIIALIDGCKWPIAARAPVYVELDIAQGLDRNPYYRG
jgi:type IV secretion system protein VirD4